MDELPYKEIAEYACEDADVTYQLWKVLKEKLEEDELMRSLMT